MSQQLYEVGSEGKKNEKRVMLLSMQVSYTGRLSRRGNRQALTIVLVLIFLASPSWEVISSGLMTLLPTPTFSYLAIAAVHIMLKKY